jgi:ubiquinone/menaquinone biosynthesis C-methylase UbiE
MSTDLECRRECPPTQSRKEKKDVAQQIYNSTAAAGYEQAFAHVSSHFIPFLLRAGRLAPGQHILDIATGTGLAAEATLAIVGPAGYVTAVARYGRSGAGALGRRAERLSCG